ncbi:MAG: hydrogen peroxide-inducible genes activator [Proteobacteria bacterium]|nr:hydrogen peroxide-inducible genes activator [Pseudomonadota bacterium]MBI3499594.1 hydrogen peroxide-inducible genes activator [Pseudomonadota bacterium]
MVNLPTLKQLRHLAALAEERHFGKAALQCHVTQSTLSASIKELEETLEAPLVDRTKRRVVLTPTGEETARRARQILEDAASLTRAAQSAGEPLAGTLRMGVIPTIGPFLLPRVLGRLRRLYPRLRLYLREDLTDRLIQQLEAGEIDLVLLALPFDGGKVESEILFEDAFFFCCRADHKLARAPGVAPQRLQKETLLLLQDGHCLRQHALDACNLRTRPALDPFEATSLTTLVQMVDNGLGVTLLPELAIEAGVTKGTQLTTVKLEGKATYRKIGLAWRRGTKRREEFRLMGRELKKLAGRG